MSSVGNRGDYTIAGVICPLCGTRRAKRGCPALAQQICAVCCGTKRGVEIACPDDCAYLNTAREHPAAITMRQRQRDLALMLPFVRDLNSRQGELFSLVSTFLQRYEPGELESLVDEDLAEAARALAATFETASRGIIYEQRPASLPASRLAAALNAQLVEARQHEGSPFERDAAVVLRRFEDAVKQSRAVDPANRRAFLDVLGRVFRETRASGEHAPAPQPRLIVP